MERRPVPVLRPGKKPQQADVDAVRTSLRASHAMLHPGAGSNDDRIHAHEARYGRTFYRPPSDPESSCSSLDASASSRESGRAPARNTWRIRRASEMRRILM